MVNGNSSSGGFAYISQSKWIGIIAIYIKTEGTQIHFLSDVLVAAAWLDLKVLICSFLARLLHLSAQLNGNRNECYAGYWNRNRRTIKAYWWHLPGQGSPWQLSLSVAGPIREQSLPPCIGSGLVQFLCLNFTPPPHDTEHVVQADQSL